MGHILSDTIGAELLGIRSSCRKSWDLEQLEKAGVSQVQLSVETLAIPHDSLVAIYPGNHGSSHPHSPWLSCVALYSWESGCGTGMVVSSEEQGS